MDHTEPKAVTRSIHDANSYQQTADGRSEFNGPLTFDALTRTNTWKGMPKEQQDELRNQVDVKIDRVHDPLHPTRFLVQSDVASDGKTTRTRILAGFSVEIPEATDRGNLHLTRSFELRTGKTYALDSEDDEQRLCLRLKDKGELTSYHADTIVKYIEAAKLDHELPSKPGRDEGRPKPEKPGSHGAAPRQEDTRTSPPPRDDNHQKSASEKPIEPPRAPRVAPAPDKNDKHNEKDALQRDAERPHTGNPTRFALPVGGFDPDGHRQLYELPPAHDRNPTGTDHKASLLGELPSPVTPRGAASRGKGPTPD